MFRVDLIFFFEVFRFCVERNKWILYRCSNNFIFIGGMGFFCVVIRGVVVVLLLRVWLEFIFRDLRVILFFFMFLLDEVFVRICLVLVVSDLVLEGEEFGIVGIVLEVFVGGNKYLKVFFI